MPQPIFRESFIMNRSDELNFASRDFKIYIMDSFRQDKCAETIANMYSMILSLPPSPIYTSGANMSSPYEIQQNNPILDVYINSGGGNFEVLLQFESLFGLAKNHGFIVRTFVPAYAGSCASMLATQGTNGYRIMGEHARHFVHFGSTTNTVSRESEIDKSYQDMRAHARASKNIYLKHTKIPEKRLNELRQDEYGYLDAKECLQLGFCDWILTANGKFISKSK